MSSVPEKVKAFFSNYPTDTFASRQTIIHAQRPISDVYYITEGRVNQYDITPNGNEVVVNVFKPGAFFPMSTAINGTPNYYFFEAGTPVQIHVAPAAEAVQFLKDNPDVQFDLLSRVYRGVDGVLRRMAHLMGGDARTRLLFELLNITYRFGEAQPDGSVKIAFSESDIARQAGMARETVNRTMQDLKRSDIVGISRQGLVVKDVRQLESLLDTQV